MKSNFYKDIEETLGFKLKKHDFRIAPMISKDYCVFVKRYSKNVGLYVICGDNRAKGGDVTISLWIAPIQCPDDRIVVLNIGIKIVIFSEYEVSDEIISAAGRKINELVNNISSLTVVVEKDIEQPFLVNKSTKWFYYSKEIYSKIENAKDVEKEFERLRKVTQECISKKTVSLNKLKSECTSFINSLPDDFFSDEISSLTVNEKGDLLADALYADTLAY